MISMHLMIILLLSIPMHSINNQRLVKLLTNPVNKHILHLMYLKAIKLIHIHMLITQALKSHNKLDYRMILLHLLIVLLTIVLAIISNHKKHLVTMIPLAPIKLFQVIIITQ